MPTPPRQRRQPVPDRVLRLANLVHRLVLRASGGRAGRRAGGMPVVELTVTGRRTGTRHTVLLTSPVYAPDRVVLVASKAGADGHPQWYLNLLADPDVWVTTDGVRRPMRARPASAEERAALWPRVVRAYAGYAGYQERTGRTIPLVICQPR